MVKNFLKAWKAWAGVILLVLCVIAVVNMLLSPQDTEARASDKANAQRVEGAGDSGDFRINVDAFKGVAANGVIEPISDEVLLASEVPGVIEAIDVTEGQSVKKGDLLLRFRSRIEKAQMDAASAELQAAKARAKLAQKSQGRTARLGQGGAATEEDLDRANKEASTEEAQLMAAQARFDQNQAAFERLSIRAPRDGEILKVNFKVGEYYAPSPSEALIILGDTRELRVRIELDERDLAKIRLGSKGFFIADAFGDKRFPLTISEVGQRMGRKVLKSDDPRERNDTRVREIYGKVGDRDLGLLPGLRVTAFLSDDTP